MARMAASMGRWTVVSSMVAELLCGKAKVSASRGCGDGGRLRDAFWILSRAMSLSPFGGSSRKLWGVSDVFVSCLVDGLDASSGVEGVTSGAGGVGVGVLVAALPHRNDM